MWGVCTGEWESIPLAIFFELLWLDAFYLGAYIPPSATVAFLLVLPIHALVNGGVDQYLLTTIPIILPFTYMLVWGEEKVRLYNNHWYTAFLAFSPREGREKVRYPTPFKRYLCYQVTVTTCINLFLYWALLIIAGVVCLFVKNTIQTFPVVDSFLLQRTGVEMAMILFFGGMLGACLALRLKKAQGLFFLLSLGASLSLFIFI